MDNVNVKIKKLSVITVSQIIVGIGAGFLVKSGMGNDPMGVMVSGFARVTGITYGTVNNIVNIAIVVAMLIFYRKRLSLATLISALFVGWAIDPTVAFLSGITPPVVVNNFVYPIVACLIMSVGIAMCIAMNYGVGVTDNLILMIGDIAHKPYSFGCYLCYIIYFVIGFALKGTWGYSTIVTIILNGKLIDMFIPKFAKLCEWTEK